MVVFVPTLASWLLAGLVIVAAVLFKNQQRRQRKQSTPESHADVEKQPRPTAPKIEPHPDFAWETAEPRKFRPFKPVYHITMALQSSSPSDLIVIDSNYLTRLRDRQEIMAFRASNVIGCIPAGLPAVRELYSYLLHDYLPARYPTLFSKGADKFHSSITGDSLPLLPPADPIEAWKNLGRAVEDDMFLLEQTPEGHRCVAYLCCYPSGWDPAEKLGKLLKDIHAPVPEYQKIGASMERFFSRLEVGSSVRRINWTIETTLDLCNIAGNHVRETDTVEEDADIDMDVAHVRMELQTLTRLPETRSILFSFKTYTCPVKEIKAEGLGPELADAIEGLGKGNAPGMWKYKSAIRYGKSVCEYLRS